MTCDSRDQRAVKSAFSESETYEHRHIQVCASKIKCDVK